MKKLHSFQSSELNNSHGGEIRQAVILPRCTVRVPSLFKKQRTADRMKVR